MIFIEGHIYKGIYEELVSFSLEMTLLILASSRTQPGPQSDTFSYCDVKTDFLKISKMYKGIGDIGSTADIRMLWSAIVCLGLLKSALDLVCYSLPWTWSAIDASHLTSSFGRLACPPLHPLFCLQ